MTIFWNDYDDRPKHVKHWENNRPPHQPNRRDPYETRKKRIRHNHPCIEFPIELGFEWMDRVDKTRDSIKQYCKQKNIEISLSYLLKDDRQPTKDIDGTLHEILEARPEVLFVVHTRNEKDITWLSMKFG